MQDKEQLSRAIIKHYWPQVKLTRQGSEKDKSGIDGYLNGAEIQIKWDSTIMRNGKPCNIYHEIYEKDKGHPEQKWKPSLPKVKWYFFVTGNSTVYIAYRISSDTLARYEINRQLKDINRTSLGFLIPIKQIKGIEINVYRRTRKE